MDNDYYTRLVNNKDYKELSNVLKETGEYRKFCTWLMAHIKEDLDWNSLLLTLINKVPSEPFPHREMDALIGKIIQLRQEETNSLLHRIKNSFIRSISSVDLKEVTKAAIKHDLPQSSQLLLQQIHINDKDEMESFLQDSNISVDKLDPIVNREFTQLATTALDVLLGKIPLEELSDESLASLLEITDHVLTWDDLCQFVLDNEKHMDSEIWAPLCYKILKNKPALNELMFERTYAKIREKGSNEVTQSIQQVIEIESNTLPLENLSNEELLKLLPYFQNHVDIGKERFQELLNESGLEKFDFFNRMHPEMAYYFCHTLPPEERGRETDIYFENRLSLTQRKIIDQAIEINSDKMFFPREISEKELRQIAPYLTFCKLDACQNIVDISDINFSNCKEFICTECTYLRYLPENLPRCELFLCKECPALRDLSRINLSHCESFRCTYCPELSQIPTNLSNCRSFSITSVLLKDISQTDLSRCTDFTSISCPSLTSVTLPACINLVCIECPLLTDIVGLNVDQLTHTSILETGLSSVLIEEIRNRRPNNRPNVRCLGSQISCKFSVLKDRPEVILHELSEILEPLEVFPRISFENSPGVDVSGLQRDFFNTLFDIFEKPVEKRKLPFHLKMMEGALPQLKEPTSQDMFSMKDQARCLDTVGQMFAFALFGQDDFLTGLRFDPSLFDVLCSLSEEEINSINPGEPLPSPSVEMKLYGPIYGYGFITKFLENEELTEQDLGGLYRFLSGDREEPQDKIKELKREIQENRKRILSEIENTLKFTVQTNRNIPGETLIPAVIIIAKSMLKKSKQLHVDWERTRKLGGKVWQEQIEGVLTAKAVLDKLNFSGVTANDPAARTMEWLRDWIKNAQIEDLKKFAKALTGGTALKGKSLEIRLKRTDKDRLPISHTCFHQLELSIDYPDRETFNKKLELFIKESIAGGFTLA